MINLFVFSPNIVDATSYYRAWGPLSMLRKQIPNLNLMVSPSLNWTVAFEADIAFVQRPTLRDHLNFIYFLKEHAVPVWVDYDDDYINPTRDNPRHGTPLEGLTTNCVIEALKRADIVTVTNEHLKKVYSEHCDPNKIVIVENALDDRLLSLKSQKFEPRNVVFWRGNDTQRRDITDFSNQIFEVFKEQDKWNFCFMGYEPVPMADTMRDHDSKRYSYLCGLELFEYFRKLTSIQWGVIIKPLKDTTFARSRSNITWIEATLAGSVCLAPEWESWTDYSCEKGLVTYTDRTDFKRKLTHLLEKPQQFEQLVRWSWEYIEKNLLLSKINLKRQEIVKYLLGVDTEYAKTLKRDPTIKIEQNLGVGNIHGN